MFTGNKFTVSVLSALTLAILTACGGSSEEFLGEDKSWGSEGDKERAVKERRKHAELPAVNNPAPTSFLEGAKKMKQTDDDNKEDKEPSPKQAGNVVTVVDHDYGYKTVKFNQPGMIDYLCLKGSKSGVCKFDDNSLGEDIEKKEEEIKNKEEEIKKVEARRDEIKKIIDSDMKKWDEEHPDATIAEREKALADLREKKEVDKAEEEIANKIKKLDGELSALKDARNDLQESNKDNVLFLLNSDEKHPLEKSNYRNSHSSSKDIEDAGIVPVAGFYDKNGDLRVQKGMVGREFDGIIVLENKEDKDGKVKQRSYLRDPVAAGWSYNTFGVFQDSTKSIERGYQSIGVKTRTSAQKRKEADENFDDKTYLKGEYLPYYGRATYTGIGHAYHNDEQVTMNVKVDADFHDRHLNFETSNATAHAFEKEGHLTRVRPDLDLKGAADWAADVADFKGKVHNAGGNLEGQLEGSFYGPNAAEVGGVYGLHGKDKEGKPVNYVGGFGAKRP